MFRLIYYKIHITYGSNHSIYTQVQQNLDSAADVVKLFDSLSTAVVSTDTNALHT